MAYGLAKNVLGGKGRRSRGAKPKRKKSGTVVKLKVKGSVAQVQKAVRKLANGNSDPSASIKHER